MSTDADQTNIAGRYWRLVNDLEDLIRYGERTGHSEPGPLAIRRPASGRTGPPGSRNVAAGTGTSRSRDTRNQLSLEERARHMTAIAERVSSCTRCPLSDKRMRAVPGMGVLDPLVMVIGEGPGADEDRRGLPFVGRAGQYLDKWLEAIHLSRDENTFIGNIVKCRPPGNRDPLPAESDACIPFLREQIELVRPKAILSVGRIASGILIGTSAGIGSLRGRTYYFSGIPLVPTYHPAGVLRNPQYRKPVWDDLQRLAGIVGIDLKDSGDGSPGGAEHPGS